jgi:NAD(P)H-nitrite reductase large subunit
MDECGELHPAVRGLKTVCRCNNVKYRTIARAIRDGAASVSQIAARTTATTGYCGGSCTPDIQQMLADLAPAKATPCAMSPKSGAAAPAEAWWLRKK